MLLWFVIGLAEFLCCLWFLTSLHLFCRCHVLFVFYRIVRFRCYCFSVYFCWYLLSWEFFYLSCSFLFSDWFLPCLCYCYIFLVSIDMGFNLFSLLRCHVLQLYFLLGMSVDCWPSCRIFFFLIWHLAGLVFAWGAWVRELLVYLVC